MTSLRPILAILHNDGLRLLRDQFLLGISAYIMICAVALRWILPWLETELLELGFELAPHIPLAVSYFVLVNASVLTGMVAGFLLLETREERTIHALLVTPTPLSVHLGTLLLAVMCAGFLIATVLSGVVGLGTPSWPAILVSAAVGAPTGVVNALFLATVADNKVEAFAVMKITSFLGLMPIAAWFIPEPYQLLAGISPAYWACKIWWLDVAGQPWAWPVMPGLLCSGVWCAALLRRFQRIAAT